MTRALRVAVALALIAGASSFPRGPTPTRRWRTSRPAATSRRPPSCRRSSTNRPGYSDGYFLLGHCMLKMGDPSTPSSVPPGPRIDPAPAHYQGLAMALKAPADWVRTIQVTSEGLVRAARTPHALHVDLAARLRLGSAPSAGTTPDPISKPRRRIREEPWVLVLLGKAYFNTGAFGSAVPPLVAALRYAPDDPTVLRLLAESYLRVAGNEPDTGAQEARVHGGAGLRAEARVA